MQLEQNWDCCYYSKMSERRASDGLRWGAKFKHDSKFLGEYFCMKKHFIRVEITYSCWSSALAQETTFFSVTEHNLSLVHIKIPRAHTSSLQALGKSWGVSFWCGPYRQSYYLFSCQFQHFTCAHIWILKIAFMSGFSQYGWQRESGVYLGQYAYSEWESSSVAVVNEWVCGTIYESFSHDDISDAQHPQPFKKKKPIQSTPQGTSLFFSRPTHTHILITL